MKKNKTLVIYFSRTGHSKTIAEFIKNATQSDMEEITSEKKWNGVIGYIKAGHSALTKKTPQIEKARHNPANYSEIIFVTPVWAGTMCSPVRSYIKRYSKEIKLATVVTVAMSTGASAAAKELSNKYGIKINKAISLTNSDIENNLFQNKFKEEYK